MAINNAVDMRTFDVVVVGGGAAGMMSAISAGGSSVALLEGNEKLGKKLYITGNGRCNVTNNSSVADIISNVVTNPKFCISAVNKLPPQEVMSLLDAADLQLKTERGNRVFPVSDKASDVIKAFNRLLEWEKVNVFLNCLVQSVDYVEGQFFLNTSLGRFSCSKLILACGGASYPKTGSNGVGYAFAKRFGHTIVEPRAALSPILVKEDVSGLEGVSLKNVALSCVVGGKSYGGEMGEMLFTANGVSGPLVLTLSSKITRLNLDDAYLSIDFKPALSVDELDKRVLRDFEQVINRQFCNALDNLLPKSMISAIIEASGVEPRKPVHQITSEERARLVSVLKGFRLSVLRIDSLERAIVTSGGVCVSEVSPSTMESKILPGLYFAGEMLDIDALTGGYNIQLALSTGFVAGRSAGSGYVGRLRIEE